MGVAMTKGVPPGRVRARGAIRTLTLFFYYGIHSLMVKKYQYLSYLSW